MPAALGAFILPSLAGTFTASLVGGAIIGAGVGALTAAVTGGNIFKGALFGAVGGAVLGGVSFGLDKAFSAIQLSTSGVGQSSLQGVVGHSSTYGIGPAAGGVAAPTGGSSSFLGSVGTFMKSQGGMAFGMQAVSSGIKGVADVYAQKRAGESAEALAERQHQMNLETMEQQHKYAKELQASAKTGTGSTGPDYTIEQLMARDTNAAEQERQTVLAKVGAEIEGQRGLRQMDFAETAAARERAAAAATALRGNKRTGSRSDKTLVDTIEDAKGGEDVDVGVDVGVDYNPGPFVAPEDVYRTA